MKKVLKFFMFLIIAGVLAVGGYFIYLKFFASTGTVDAFNTIPEDAVFIIETTNLSEAWTTINDSELWQHLTETDYFADLNEDIETVNGFLDSNAVADMLLNNRKLIVSGIMASPKEWDFLFAVDLEKGSGTVQSLNKMIDLIPDFKVNRTEYKNGKDKYTIIKMTDKKAPDFKVFITFADNIVLVSFNGSIIEKSLSQLTDNHWQTNEKFVSIMQKIPQRELFKIYVNYSKLDDFTGTFLTDKDETISMISNSLAFSVLNLDFTKDKIVLDGFANLDSTGSYIHALADVPPGKMTAYEIMTDQAAAYVSIAFDDYSTFYNNLMNEYTKNFPEEAKDIDKSLDLLKNVIKINIEEDFFSWIGNEIALFKIRPLSTLSKQEDAVLVIHANDIENAQKGMEHIIKQIRKWSPFKFKEFDYKNYKINYLKQKAFFKPFFGKMFEGIDEPYFTYIEDYVVFSNSQEVLMQIIDDYIDGRTLSKSDKFQDFFDNFSVKSNICTFIMMPKMYQTLYYFTPATDRSDLKENQELIMSFARVGFQLVSKGDMFTTTLIAEYDPDAYFEDLTEKIETEAQDDIFTEYIDTLGFKINLDENMEDGKYIDYYGDSDKIRIEGNVIDSKPDGLWRSYYEDENIESVVTYKNQMAEGVAYFYYDDVSNTLRAEVNFEEDKCVGTYREYYDNGARKANIMYENGLKDGDVEFYYRTGSIKIKGKYKDGKKHKKWTFYDDKGEQISIEKWKNGVKIKEK